MNIFKKIKESVRNFGRFVHQSENPKGERFNFINDIDAVKRKEVDENLIWYVGNSNELLNYYTNRDIMGNATDPIYYRNKQFYFWGINAKETNIKRVHSGLPRAIVDTLCNVIGMPEITIQDENKNQKLQEILESNKFNILLNQQARPLTLVEGWGAYKIVFDKNLSEHPILQYYEAKDVSFITKQGIVIGIVYIDYYKLGKQDYILLETRYIENGDSVIKYQLLRQNDREEGTPVPLSTIEELADIPEEGYRIKGLKKILGVPSRYFFDVQNKDYGKSIFNGKLDLFDDLDQSLSQRSTTCRVSTPVEYFPEDVLEKGRNGEAILPTSYDRKFIKKPSIPNGDGDINSDIQTTQPVLNFDQYSQEQVAIVNMIATGIISLATMGVDIAKKDNAEAQREKEKVTIMTRNNIMDMETEIIKDLCDLLLKIQEFMDSGVISLDKNDISVKYSEFANPSFESLSSVLSPMYANGSISTKMYVEKLYGDSLSDEEKAQEIEWLEQKSQQDNLQMGDFDLNGTDENTINEIMGTKEPQEESIGAFEK